MPRLRQSKKCMGWKLSEWNDGFLLEVMPILIEVNYFDGSSETLKGTITLVR